MGVCEWCGEFAFIFCSVCMCCKRKQEHWPQEADEPGEEQYDLFDN